MLDLDALTSTVFAALEGLNIHSDCSYKLGSDEKKVWVAVDDLEGELTGMVTQHGAILTFKTSEVVPVQGATVEIAGQVWKIGRRLESTDPALVSAEAYKMVST